MYIIFPTGILIPRLQLASLLFYFLFFSNFTVPLRTSSPSNSHVPKKKKDPFSIHTSSSTLHLDKTFHADMPNSTLRFRPLGQLQLKRRSTYIQVSRIIQAVFPSPSL
ncbi:hypothetical protein F4809DRAFT_633705 [Biscogniauxia mediterranea]|nr:hypothetical protein F4809DRAFT_633705 [Biscogniauxia mediterranea]